MDFVIDAGTKAPLFLHEFSRIFCVLKVKFYVVVDPEIFLEAQGVALR